MFDKIKEFLDKANSKGIPVPMMRAEGKPSLTATFAFLSFNMSCLGHIGKVTKLIGAVDLQSANYLFFGCLAAYLGRRMTGDKTKIEINGKENEK